MKAKEEVREAGIMLSNNRPLMEVIDRIWSGCNFEWSNPRFVPESLPIAFTLYDRCKPSKNREELGQCMLLLGRIFNARKDYLPACRFYLCASKTLVSCAGIIAIEFFREELRAPGAHRQIGLGRDAFEKEYAHDTPEGLVAEYRNAAPAKSADNWLVKIRTLLFRTR